MKCPKISGFMPIQATPGARGEVTKTFFITRTSTPTRSNNLRDHEVTPAQYLRGVFVPWASRAPERAEFPGPGPAERAADAPVVCPIMPLTDRMGLLRGLSRRVTDRPGSAVTPRPPRARPADGDRGLRTVGRLLARGQANGLVSAGRGRVDRRDAARGDGPRREARPGSGYPRRLIRSLGVPNRRERPGEHGAVLTSRRSRRVADAWMRPYSTGSRGHTLMTKL
jgi:hypothetical protein